MTKIRFSFLVFRFPKNNSKNKSRFLTAFGMTKRHGVTNRMDALPVPLYYSHSPIGTPLKDVNASLREVAVLQEATEMILSSMDADTVLHQILLIVRNYFAVDQCGVFLMDHTSQELYCRAQNGYDDPKILTRRFRPGRDGVVGAVAAAKVPMYIPDVSQEPLFIPGSARTKSELSLPL